MKIKECYNILKIYRLNINTHFDPFVRKCFELTDKELRKLRRKELLELLFYLRRDLDEVKKENESLRRQLEEKTNSQDELHDFIRKASVQLDKLCLAQLGETAAEDEHSADGDTETDCDSAADEETEQ